MRWHVAGPMRCRERLGGLSNTTNVRLHEFVDHTRYRLYSVPARCRLSCPSNSGMPCSTAKGPAWSELHFGWESLIGSSPITTDKTKPVNEKGKTPRLFF